MSPLRRLRRFLVIAALLLPGISVAAAGLQIAVADISGPAFAARGIMLTLPDDGSADLRVAQLEFSRYKFTKIRLQCAGFSLSSAALACRDGRLEALPGARLAFTYQFPSRRLALTLTAAGGESWQVEGAFGAHGWQLAAQLRNARSARLVGLLPASMPLPTTGVLAGALRVAGDTAGPNAVSADLRVDGLSFADADSQHVAEQLGGTLQGSAQRRGAGWDWRGQLAWQSGELYWQPWYLQGGYLQGGYLQGGNLQGAHALQAAGRLQGDHLLVDDAQADLPGVGRMRLAADWDMARRSLRQATVRGEILALDRLFDTYLKPVLGKGLLAEASLAGQADLAAEYRDGALQSLRVDLHDAGIADAAQRFALNGVNSALDWRASEATSARIAFAGGALLGVPLGAGAWTVNMQGLDFSAPQAELAVLDGRLTLQDLHCYRIGEDWRWHFAGALSPVSMERLSALLGWPKMLGMLAGRIPEVSYDGAAVRVKGALLFDVFDGTVVATGIELSNAFGRAPRLSGTLKMRNLDLDLLTRTFSFGNMQGRMDADVHNLELQDWQPVRFDARLYSSAGSYPKQISQKAVQNISSLGGAGAAAALQRSFLGFFENFGYDRIGWSCAMRNGVCNMGGLEGEEGSSYTLVRGGGIPAISVMGYNRAVSWPELVTRLKRVTQQNVKPLVR